jgi:HEAT repeat protein
MWELLLAVPFLAGGIATWGTIRYNRQRLQRWAKTLRSCGLQVTHISKPSSRLKVEARVGPVGVRVENARKQKQYRDTQVIVTFPGPPGFGSVRIRRELVNPLPWVRETEVGDPNFDVNFYLGGPPALVCALLDAETRELLTTLNAGCQLEIVTGEIRAQMFGSQMDILVPLLLDLCKRFSHPADVPSRLAANAQRESLADVRLQNLTVLTTDFPGHPKTLEALRAVCWDASPQIRLRAAIELREEGRDLLVQMAEGLEDDECSAKAVSVLGPGLEQERAREVLARALRRRRIQTARACLETLGKLGPAEVDILAKVMVIERGELAAVAALALGTTGSAAAEPPLIHALERDQADLQVAAANALAAVGSPAAVLPLKELAERFPRDKDLRRATRQAIAAIHSRLAGASPGQLSLADHEVGQLSLAEAEAGQLSLATEAAGRLSLMGPHLPAPPLPKREEGEKPPGSAGIPAG